MRGEPRVRSRDTRRGLGRTTGWVARCRPRLVERGKLAQLASLSEMARSFFWDWVFSLEQRVLHAFSTVDGWRYFPRLAVRSPLTSHRRTELLRVSSRFRQPSTDSRTAARPRTRSTALIGDPRAHRTQPSNRRAEDLPFLQVGRCDDNQQGSNYLNVLALHRVRPDLERWPAAVRTRDAVRPLRSLSAAGSGSAQERRMKRLVFSTE
jgi:hypothetical protein